MKQILKSLYNTKNRVVIDNLGVVFNLNNPTYKSIRNKFVVKYRYFVQKIIFNLSKENYSTSRELYYQNRKLFNSPNIVERMVKDLCCTLNVRRVDLNIISKPKGLVYGDLIFSHMKNSIDCKRQSTGILIPSEGCPFEIISSDAKLILIVEKYAIFNKLICNKICEKFKLIMV